MELRARKIAVLEELREKVELALAEAPSHARAFDGVHVRQEHIGEAGAFERCTLQWMQNTHELPNDLLAVKFAERVVAGVALDVRAQSLQVTHAVAAGDAERKVEQRTSGRAADAIEVRIRRAVVRER